MLGQRLKTLREAKRLTQRELGDMVGVSDSAVGQWENDRREPSVRILVKLAQIFGVSVDYLLGRKDNEPADLEDFLMSRSHITYNGWEMGPEEKEDVRQFLRIAKRMASRRDQGEERKSRRDQGEARKP